MSSANGIKRFFSPVSRPGAAKPDQPPAATPTPKPFKDIQQERSPVDSPEQSHKRFCATPSRNPQDNGFIPANRVQDTPETPRTGTINTSRHIRPLVDTPRSSSSSHQHQPTTPSTPSIRPETNGSQPAESDDAPVHPHLSYQFLYPPHRRDIEMRKPDHPDYDEKTLFVPNKFLDEQTPALRQWWLIKQKNMDAVLFFKMGKFYELFNDDAVLGVKHLDIMYMKGDETKPAHAGFPEIAYEKYSKILINKGFKVMRIEQTETPAMVEDRCQSTGKKGKFDRVVRREVCRVTTKGTQMLSVMDSVFHSCHNQYLLAVQELSMESENGTKQHIFGVCFLDITIGKMHMGQFTDDRNQSKLNILLAHHKPTEVLYEKGNLGQSSLQAIMKTGAMLTMLRPKEFWPIKRALGHLKNHRIFEDLSGNFEWPPFLKGFFHEGETSESLMAFEPKEEYELALHSFGAIVYYLQSQLILGQALRCIAFELYKTPLEKSDWRMQQVVGSTEVNVRPPMILDHIALRNLEIFENSTGGTTATLFESINYCKTHFGQRLLKNWVCSPLCDVKQIENRLDAVQALISNDNASLMNEFTHVLGQLPDLERMLSKIKSQCFKSEGDSKAIMFDGNQYSKAKITSFLNLLSNFKRLQKFVVSVSKSAKNTKSHVLERLLSFTTDGGLYPDYSATLEYFESAFDQDLAKKTGTIIPAPGVDKAYDDCEKSINEIKAKLDEHLEEQKVRLKCRTIEYFGTAKNRYQIQVPDSYCHNLPAGYRIETTRKGFKRYYTPVIDNLFPKLTVREEEMKKIVDNIMSKIFEQFSMKFKLWSAAIECISIIDVLQSIANSVRSLMANDVPMCRPQFIESTIPSVVYVDGRHPALVKKDPNYIPNNLTLDNKLILLSGANMGGKSTLMRQTALLVVLAQIGSLVPATSMRMTPVDRIFSRLGASDSILEGESTFYTELVETSAMLSCATSDSLLLLDELGRGTSTYDGTAIAYSVIKELSKNIKCRCLFSTHYHTLVRDFMNDDRVRLAHMACKVETANASDNEVDLDPLKENITFLYKIADGPVGRSYGFNVAKLAGINDQIIREAFKKAKEIELGSKVLETLQRLSVDGPSFDVSPEELKAKVVAALSKP